MTLPQPRPAVAKMSQYRPPLEGRRDKIRLDFNENTVGFPQVWPEGLATRDTAITTYPEYQRLTEAIAALWNLPAESILLTNGSDEALSIIPQTFIEAKIDRALHCQPTFAMIVHSLKLAEAELTPISLTPTLHYDLAAMEAALSETFHKLVIIASPDNPTGATLPKETLTRWCRQFPQTLFVLDEAYSEYMGEAFTAVPLVADHPNLVVTRTFSKAWGMAGLRLGYIVAHPQIISWLQCVRSPYSINTIAVETALCLLEHRPRIWNEAELTLQRRQRLMEALVERGYKVRAGGGNFFLLKLGFASRLMVDYCAQRGVLVRDQSHQHLLAGNVRVSTGTEGENQTFLQAVDGFQRETALVFDLDDTLVDTSQSFDAVVQALVNHYAPDQPLDHQELLSLRVEGGYNDDWDATVALLARRGVSVDRAEIEQEGCRRYLAIARQTEALLLPIEALEALSQRYRLFIFTGRQRTEYQAVWGDRLDRLFEAVYCSDDIAGARRKPAPDYLCALRERHGLAAGWYIGNSVDDMACALAAGFDPIGVAKNQPADRLQASGARRVYDTIAECLADLP